MANYVAYEKLRSRLIEVVQREQEVARKLKLDEAQKNSKSSLEILKGLEERVRSEKFIVLLIGCFNVGKSTFINAMLGQKILPTMPIPTTAVLCRLCYSEEKKITMYPTPGPNAPNKGKPFDIKVEELGKYVAIDHELNTVESPYARMEMYWPLPMCKNGVEIIDSVGLNDPKSRDHITMGYADRADAILYLMSCATAYSKDDANAIQITKGFGFTSPFFLMTHADLIDDPDDEKTIKEYVSKNVAPLTELGEKGVFYVDSKRALNGRIKNDSALIEQSRIQEAEKALENFLVTQKGVAKVITNLKALQEQNNRINTAIQTRRAMIDKSTDELRKMMATLTQPLDNLRVQKENLVRSVNNRLDSIVLETARMADSFFLSLPQSVQEYSKKYNLTKSPGVIPRKSTIEPVIKEVSNALRTYVDQEACEWQESVLVPFISQKLKEIESLVNESGKKFTTNLDLARSQVFPELDPGKDSIVNNSKPQLWERVVGGLAIYSGAGILAGGVGMVFGVKAMVANIVTQIVTGLVASLWLGLTMGPAVILAMIAGILHAGIMGASAGEKIKTQTTEHFIDALRNTRADSIRTIQEKVRNKFRGLMESLENVLNADMDSLRNEIQIKIEAGQKSESEKRAEKALLESQGQENLKLSDLLSNIAIEAAAIR